jgi:CheY-like chemotaxis protein
MESKTKLPFINLRSPEPADRMTLLKKPKILMVDNDPKGRKDRINILRAHGFSAYPALNMQQARTRCRPGAYDLIVVNPRDEKEQALEFCDAIKKQNPQQLLLLMTPANAEVGDRDDTVSDNPQALLERVEAMFPKLAAASEGSVAA